MRLIHIKGNIYVDADANCYVLGELREYKNKNDELTKQLGKTTFHTTMGSAIKSAIQRSMRAEVSSNNITTLKEYLTALNALVAELETITNQYDKEVQKK